MAENILEVRHLKKWFKIGNPAIKKVGVNYTSDRHKIYRQIFYFNYIMLVHKNTYLLFILLPFDGAGYG